MIFITGRSTAASAPCANTSRKRLSDVQVLAADAADLPALQTSLPMNTISSSPPR